MWEELLGNRSVSNLNGFIERVQRASLQVRCNSSSLFFA
jgi:hypothetical protein